jgi:hypothetical protein
MNRRRIVLVTSVVVLAVAATYDPPAAVAEDSYGYCTGGGTMGGDCRIDTGSGWCGHRL